MRKYELDIGLQQYYSIIQKKSRITRGDLKIEQSSENTNNPQEIVEKQKEIVKQKKGLKLKLKEKKISKNTLFNS